jgi:renalase
MQQPKTVAIIGAGLAGVGCASVLEESNISTCLFEKSRGLGGRCSTRDWEGYAFDHGAQYFTLRSPEFSSYASKACGLSLQEIKAPILDQTRAVIPSKSPRFYHRSGNKQLAQDLGLHLSTALRTEVLELKKGDGVNRGKWGIGDHFFDAVVSTAPWPQTARIFGLSAQNGPSYLPCLTLLLLYRGEWLGNSREHYAVSDHSNHPLLWSACENHKANRVATGFTGMVAQASAEFSQQYLESPAEEWAKILQEMVEERWKIPHEAFVAKLTHRWRYARICKKMNLPELPQGLYYTGDAVSESRVESAWLAGRALGQKLALSSLETQGSFAS